MQINLYDTLFSKNKQLYISFFKLLEKKESLTFSKVKMELNESFINYIFSSNSCEIPNLSEIISEITQGKKYDIFNNINSNKNYFFTNLEIALKAFKLKYQKTIVINLAIEQFIFANLEPDLINLISKTPNNNFNSENYVFFDSRIPTKYLKAIADNSLYYQTISISKNNTTYSMPLTDNNMIEEILSTYPTEEIE